MNREQAKEIIKQRISCTDYLEKSKNGLYCCPKCGSGHGSNGTGAVKYYPNTNTWYCHACEEGGDVIDAYTAANDTDYNSALLSLAAKEGLQIDQRTTAAEDFAAEPIERPQRGETKEKDTQDGADVKSPQRANIERTEQPADYTAYYEKCRGALHDPAAVSYLAARGISIDTASSCGIGYDPAADPAAAPGATGNEYKAHPAARIIIPCSRSHYVARSIDPDTPYSFKAMNPNTQRGAGRVSLFNEEAIHSGAPVVFITEGAFDALSFIEAGAAAVALNSKGNGKLLLQRLQDQRTAAAFVICHDNDADPNTAADTMKRAAELNNELLRLNYKSIVYNVAGKYHDANDALREDRTAFERNIAAAIHELQRDNLSDFLDKIQTEAYKPHRTGEKFFDDLLSGGIVRQSLLLLMAAPGTGKTTLAQQIAETIAEQGNPIIYLNFEMSREQMLAKAISARLLRKGQRKTALQILQGYDWSIEDRAEIESTIEEYRRSSYPFIIYNPAGISGELSAMLSYLKAAGDAAKAEGKQAPAAVVDYLHLITSRDGIDTAELIKQAVTGLKQYAVDYDTFVIGIIATNRDSNKGGRLTMESGRDSSNLEYTGDYIISLNYEAVDKWASNKKAKDAVNPNDVNKLAELQQKPMRAMILRVLKSRFSQPGRSATVMFDAAHNMFYPATDFEPAEGFITDDTAPSWEEDAAGLII